MAQTGSELCTRTSSCSEYKTRAQLFVPVQSESNSVAKGLLIQPQYTPTRQSISQLSHCFCLARTAD